VKLDQQSLALIVDLIAQGESFDGAAKICGCTRRSIYNYIENSRRAQAADALIVGKETTTETLELPKYNHTVSVTTTESKFTPYYIPERGWFHDLILQAKSPWQIDPSTRDLNDQELMALGYRDRFLRDENGDRIPVAAEQPPPMDDIAAERAAAREWQAKEKHKPEGRVEIFRPTGNPSDPQERVTARPPEKSVAQREREHPRRWDQEVPPLHTPPPRRPSYARPLDSYDPTGARELPDTMRQTVVTETVLRSAIRHDGPLTVHDGRSR